MPRLPVSDPLAWRQALVLACYGILSFGWFVSSNCEWLCRHCGWADCYSLHAKPWSTASWTPLQVSTTATIKTSFLFQRISVLFCSLIWFYYTTVLFLKTAWRFFYVNLFFITLVFRKVHKITRTRIRTATTTTTITVSFYVNFNNATLDK